MKINNCSKGLEPAYTEQGAEAVNCAHSGVSVCVNQACPFERLLNVDSSSMYSVPICVNLPRITFPDGIDGTYVLTQTAQSCANGAISSVEISLFESCKFWEFSLISRFLAAPILLRPCSPLVSKAAGVDSAACRESDGASGSRVSGVTPADFACPVPRAL